MKPMGAVLHTPVLYTRLARSIALVDRRYLSGNAYRVHAMVESERPEYPRYRRIICRKRPRFDLYSAWLQLGECRHQRCSGTGYFAGIDG